MPDQAAPPTLHATCVAIGEAGVLIRGPSGSGKSTLALHLILDAPRVLPPAQLVADDRVLLMTEDGALVARPAPPLAGLIEARGLGIRRLVHRPWVVLKWVIDLAAADATRLPARAALQTQIQGIDLKRISAEGPREARLLLAAALTTDDHEN